MEKGQLFLRRDFFVDSRKDPIENYYKFDFKQLGRGTFGTVYKGKLLTKQNTYRAIKVVNKTNISQFNQVFTEIQMLKKLDHPSIVRLYETFENERFIYIVTDLLEGGELFQHLDRRGEFSQSQAKDIFTQALQAVNYCHQHFICHRDLKPENLIFLNDHSLNLKLIDFGLTFMIQSREAQIERQNFSLIEKSSGRMSSLLKSKRQSAIVGTPYYIAPEVLNGDYDQRCDIWSMGVILYILVTGMPPFNGDSNHQIMENVKTYNYSINSDQTKNLTPELKDLISKILVPAQRRITIKQIFKHPWMSKKPSLKRIKLNFRKMSKFSNFSKIKAIAASYIASQMGQKDIQNLGQIFREMDINHDGYLTFQEIQTSLKKQKQKVNVDELRQLIDTIDTDRNGKINYNEFIASCLQSSILYKQKNLLSVFKMLDRDHNGTISVNQLKQVLKCNIFILTKEQTFLSFNQNAIDEIMKLSDKNQDGKIDYLEFLQTISDL